MTTPTTLSGAEWSPAFAPRTLGSDKPVVTVTGSDGSVRLFSRGGDPLAAATSPSVVYYVSETAAPPETPTDALADFIAEFSATPHGAAAMAEGRRWVAENFYADGLVTLAGLRLRAGLSQAQLAERCGLQQPHVSRYESGRHSPGIDQAAAMAGALGVTLDEFFAALKASRDRQTEYD